MSILLSNNHTFLIYLSVPKDYLDTIFLNLEVCATDDNDICGNASMKQTEFQNHYSKQVYNIYWVCSFSLSCKYAIT
jgi:hypothetical protein